MEPGNEARGWAQGMEPGDGVWLEAGVWGVAGTRGVGCGWSHGCGVWLEPGVWGVAGARGYGWGQGVHGLKESECLYMEEECWKGGAYF